MKPPVELQDRSAYKNAMNALPAGGRVVLFTDGIIETRSLDLDDGLDRLLAELAADPQVTAQALAHRLRDPDDADDVCVLTAGFAG